MVANKSVIRELVDEHGINSITVPCPCTGKDGNPILRCRYCDGSGKLQYGIGDVEVFS